jgi:GTP-binding protein Era
MEDYEVEAGHRSGYVALIGRPNVGKSTLINTIMGQPIAAVSPKPQTTRQGQLGILTLPEAQIIFVDTPGIHKPIHKLGEAMNRAAHQALEDADLLLVVFDLSEPPNADDRRVADLVNEWQKRTEMLIVLNKRDRVESSEIPTCRAAFEELIPGRETLPLSALDPRQVADLVERLIPRLPEGPRYYPQEQITTAYERGIAADLIRSAAMGLLRQELPHSIAVRVEKYKDRGDNGAYIRATIFTERESQKGIVIGSGGRMLKAIGTRARQQIEEMSGRSVFLDLRVKVMARWRDDPRALAQFGYPASRE